MAVYSPHGTHDATEHFSSTAGPQIRLIPTGVVRKFVPVFGSFGTDEGGGYFFVVLV